MTKSVKFIRFPIDDSAQISLISFLLIINFFLNYLTLDKYPISSNILGTLEMIASLCL